MLRGAGRQRGRRMKATAVGYVTYSFSFDVEGEEVDDVVNTANLSLERHFPRHLTDSVRAERTGMKMTFDNIESEAPNLKSHYDARMAGI